jgi:CubicO group peptidase (beta-lactamase class C family)
MLSLLWILGCSGKGGDSAATESDADTDSDTDTDTDAGPITKEDETAILTQAAADVETYAATGAQIAVWFDGRVAYHWEVGTTGESGAPITEDMLFQIGSDTKKLTAIALLQQEDAGLLSRNDALESRVEGYEIEQDPTWSSTVTFHHLMSHQGETFDYTPWDPAPDDEDLQNRAGVFADQGWIYAPPGSYWSYSNPNFALTGRAIEEVTGRAYADVVQEDVLDPLGLTHSFARLDDVVKYGNIANGHGYSGWADDPFDAWTSGGTWVSGEVELDEFVENAFTRPAGLVWSTAVDMATLGGFFLEGDRTVLSDEARWAILSPQVRIYPTFAASTYGYGTFQNDGFTVGDDFYDAVLIQHGGNTLSMTSLWLLLPASGVTISILSNGYTDDFGATAVEILKRLDVLPAPTEMPADFLPHTETDHSLLAGIYMDPVMGEIEVWEQGPALKIAIPELEDLGYHVTPSMVSYFRNVYLVTIEGSTYDFTFTADDTGAYRWLVNRTITGTRVETLTWSIPDVADRLARIHREMTLHEGSFRPRLGMPPLPPH